VRDLAHQLGADVTLSRNEFFEHGMRIAMSYETTLAGTAAQVADRLEEVFEATGGRGGFMLGHTVADPLDLVRIVDLLVPELQRRGRFRRKYRGTTLRENLLEE
jgi:alkanesulfonate monooxygenase SsuD/methylene tetrahydromethanopterin reductase-like flavin-dependent oxidoreductase (luciferase family)